MYPKVAESPLPNTEGITAEHKLFDLVYNPFETKFLKDGKACGASIKNGYSMLIYQAEESWKIWNRLAKK